MLVTVSLILISVIFFSSPSLPFSYLPNLPFDLGKIKLVKFVQHYLEYSMWTIKRGVAFAEFRKGVCFKTLNLKIGEELLNLVWHLLQYGIRQNNLAVSGGSGRRFFYLLDKALWEKLPRKDCSSNFLR